MAKVIISEAMVAGFNAADAALAAKGTIALIADFIALLDESDKEGLATLRGEIITGVIARDMFAGVTLTAANVTKAQAIILKAGKERTDTESRAEQNGRKIWSRAMKAAGRTSSHGNAEIGRAHV